MAQSILVNSLDFDNIKSSLKTHLSNTSVFKDYDFEGSGLSVILDLLAYTTYYQGIYNNFVANEMFITTAESRSAVVSHAKSLGYVARSQTAPTATVNVTLGVTAGLSTTFRSGGIFTTKVGNRTYRFTNIESATIDLNPSGTAEHITALPIKEGVIRTISSVIANNRDYQKVVIPDSNVDTSTINVIVQSSISDTTGITNVWSKSTDLSSVTGGSRAYFIEQDYTGKYSVNFGDGVIGGTLAPGNLVTVSYLSTSGPLTNGVGINDASRSTNSFTYLAGNTVDVVSPAAGGALPQSVESIRKIAPRSYAAQNRAVTSSDFEAIVQNNFSGFSSVLAYGGEEADPPQYGRVFVSLKPVSNQIVTDSLKTEVEKFLKQKCPLAVEPVVITPDLLYIQVSTDFTFDPNSTPLTEVSLSSLVERLTNIYMNANTLDYDTTVSKTLLEQSIIDTESSITSLNTTFRMERRVTPVDNRTSYSFDFGNPIFHPHDGHQSVVFSNEFTYYDETTGTNKVVRVKDDGSGKLIMFQLINNVENVVLDDFGDVDYEKGVVTFNLAQLTFAGRNSDIRVNAVSANNIIRSTRNLVMTHDTSSTPGSAAGTTVVAPTATGSAAPASSGGGGGGGGYGGY